MVLYFICSPIEVKPSANKSTMGAKIYMKNASTVFYVSLAILTGLVLMGMMMPASLEQITSSAQGFITDSFGWYYLVLVSLFVFVSFYLLVSPVAELNSENKKISLSFHVQLGLRCFLVKVLGLD